MLCSLPPTTTSSYRTTTLVRTPTDELNRTSITKNIEQEPRQDWQEGQRHERGWSHTHVWWLRIKKNISAADVHT